MMFASDAEYAEFTEWKQKRDAEQAERDRQKRLKAAERERHDDYIRNRRIDQELMRGVNDGLSWAEFLRQTAAPSDLKDRYLELQQQSGIKPGSKTGEDPFEKAFKEAGF